MTSETILLSSHFTRTVISHFQTRQFRSNPSFKSQNALLRNDIPDTYLPKIRNSRPSRLKKESWTDGQTYRQTDNSFLNDL